MKLIQSKLRKARQLLDFFTFWEQEGLLGLFEKAFLFIFKLKEVKLLALTVASVHSEFIPVMYTSFK